MGLIGDLAQAILITWVVFWVYVMIWFFTTGQIGLALLFLVGLLISLSFIAYEYWQYRKK